MGFSEKIQRYWKDKGLRNIDISNIMEGYPPSLISRYNNQDKLSPTYLKMITKYFPDAPIDEFITDVVPIEKAERIVEYKNRTEELISEIEARLKELRSNLSQI